ncbi:hypothetical protein HRI_001238600 [Hibiscus trionum]|uniref:BHLH domain-containing protein n=1 Tax=Hibiscus trionum TaxID=183268 RepID=A0A9W7LT39_HIBTR|nr:hypothetical protein HRI_001238600 [Hibiscus trionum]
MASFSYHSLLLSPINNSSSQFYDATEAEHVTQNVKRKTTLDSAQSMEQETGKKRKQKKCNDSMENEKKEKEAPTEYIHVRARRGQATDSHSLAERARREKISERMKILQSLVPGCDKVSGKALMLDEIINYVQSLQNQVEFLSMKLASVNPMFYDFGVDLDALMVKPEGLMNSVASPPLQQCNPVHPTFAPPLLDASAAVFLHQGGRWPSQDNAGLLWDSGCFH